jgi:hypothetical protein
MPSHCPQSPLTPQAPVVVLAAPGSIGPRQRVTQALAAGSLLVVAFRPMPGLLPRAAASAFVVTNLNASGVGSLAQAVQNANAQLGADTVTFVTVWGDPKQRYTGCRAIHKNRSKAFRRPTMMSASAARARTGKKSLRLSSTPRS